ncbi:S9 family peptidase [Subtercola sp. Z020]|uniref:alpha/beta hydrolase family protein n=1 Tax=Subtercola sp. Z020 TaxID=2080582 RepID=UPI00130DB61F|nr:prolyl oligopeptidase family serine peptidase [Subtercola sp. Z020]
MRRNSTNAVNDTVAQGADANANANADADARAGLSRRGLLGLAATGGAGAVLFGGAASATAAPATAAQGLASLGGAKTARVLGDVAPVNADLSFDPGLTPFPLQGDLNFQAQFNYGESAYGAAEVGEVASAVAAATKAMEGLTSADLPVYQPFNDSFEALAVRLATEADAELAAGRFVSARSKYLRAAGYYTGVLFFVLGTDAPTREADIYRSMQRCWAAAAALLEPVWTRVEIPATVRFPDAAGNPVAQNIVIPAYWARASGTGAKPTVIINNGSDAQLVDTYAYGGAAALERGYNALMFEGPGQGSMLFEQDLSFTPWWEDVISPLVDFVIAQPETDPAAVALTGWSFGGLLVLRAAAHEPRLKAVVADPALWDCTQPYLPLKGITDSDYEDYYTYVLPKTGLPPAVAQSQAQLRFLLNKRGEIMGREFHANALTGKPLFRVTELLAAFARYNGDAALFGQITAHSLLISYEADVFFDGQGAQVAAWMTGAASVTSHRFDSASGAEFHDAPLAPQVRNEWVFDWLDGIFGHAPTPPAPPAPPVPPAPVPPVPGPAPAPVIPGVDSGAGGAAKPGLAATGLEAGPIAAIAGGLATAGAGAAVLASRLKSSRIG